MKKIMRRAIAAVMAAVFAFAMVPKLNVEAAVQKLDDTIIYLDPSGAESSFSIYAENAKSVKSVKSSKKSVAVPYYVSRNAYNNDYMNADGKIESTSASNSAYVYYKALKAGKAQVSFKAGSTTYKKNVIVKNYVNPFKTLTISNVNKGKNLAGQFKKTKTLDVKPANSKTVKVNAVTTDDWQITSIEVSSSNYNYDYSSNNGYLSDRQTFGSERYYSTPVTKGSVKMTKYNPKGSGSVTINVKNKKDGGTLYFSINLAALNK
jgi:hypothetical protein